MAFYSGGFLYIPQNQEVLLHLRDNKTKNNPNVWAFFGGLSKGDEKPEETFKREIFEELGIHVENPIFLRDYFNPDFQTHRYVFFVKLTEKPTIKLHEGKAAEWMTLDNALERSLSKRTREDLLFFKNFPHYLDK